jgi:hypothetical protein
LASLPPADGSHFSKPRIAKSSFPQLRNACHTPDVSQQRDMVRFGKDMLHGSALEVFH